MSDSNDLTPREMEVLALAWQCMDTDPKIDYTKLAELTGYTPGSANVTFGKIKRKLKAKAAGSTGVPATPKKPNAGGRPKATPKSGKRGSADSDTADTPSKRSKKASKSAGNDDDDDEFASLKVKKEEVADVAAGADAFFQEAAAYVTPGDSEV